ncbi:MAG: hypothetical protein MZV64_34345 [Ignavibacteriales bacterium]|nr:hypothetical protein [Ignavibacteriales bacterium]
MSAAARDGPFSARIAHFRGACWPRSMCVMTFDPAEAQPRQIGAHHVPEDELRQPERDGAINGVGDVPVRHRPQQAVHDEVMARRAGADHLATGFCSGESGKPAPWGCRRGPPRLDHTVPAERHRSTGEIRRDADTRRGMRGWESPPGRAAPLPLLRPFARRPPRKAPRGQREVRLRPRHAADRGPATAATRLDTIMVCITSPSTDFWRRTVSSTGTPLRVVDGRSPEKEAPRPR